MVGMVAAMKGFNGKQGTELADLIVNKIKEAVDKVELQIAATGGSRAGMAARPEKLGGCPPLAATTAPLPTSGR